MNDEKAMQQAVLIEEELKQKAMRDVINEFRRRGQRSVERDTVMGAAKLLSQIRFDMALLDLAYLGQVAFEIVNGEVVIKEKQS